MKLMFGVHYIYGDQWGSVDKTTRKVFTSRKKAQDWIEEQPDSSYLKIVTYQVNPGYSP